MKKSTLTKKNAKGIWTLLIVLLFSFCPWLVQAQDEVYTSTGSKKVKIGTSDSRLMASIYETDTTVVMKLMAIGYMKADMIDFAFFYDPDVLRLCYPNYQEVTAFNVLQGNTAVLSPELQGKDWLIYGTHKDVGSSYIDNTLSGHMTMRAISYDLGSGTSLDSKAFEVEDGKVKEVLQCTFKKVNQGTPLEHGDIGLGVKTELVGSTYYQPKFGYDGLFLWYRDVTFSIDNRLIRPHLFLYRSGSDVTTYPATDVATTTATLNGNFIQGTITPSFEILDTTGTVRTGTGRLFNDDVIKYGFIYSTDSVGLSIAEFSNDLIIDNAIYNVPNDLEIAAGEFYRNGQKFNIVIRDNTTPLTSDTYFEILNGLDPFQKYYAWAYIHYNFETSDTFQAVGKLISFSTTDCIALNIGTVFVKDEPTCGLENGSIQVVVTGGSGYYEYSVNGEEFASYPNGIITGLGAGTYIITVRDAHQPSCSHATSQSIELYNFHSDLSISVTSNDASDCTQPDGVLYISVSGGTGLYEFTLNGEPVTVTNGMIVGLPADVYVVNVIDKGSNCVATSGEVRINSGTSNLMVTIDEEINAECKLNTGAVTFTVTGSTSYYYQLDGYPTGYATNDTPIEITGLSAGEHKLRVWDDCNEVVKTIFITNGENALAFTATTENEILSCDGTLIGGTITLEVTNGAPNFKYRVDGGAWENFAPGANTVTITNLANGYYKIEVIDNAECTYEVNNVTISREIYDPINVGTIFAKTEPTCGQNNGVIQVYATGGSGVYEYSVNGKPFTTYPNGEITGLGAGTYQIAVRDAIYTSCTEATIHSIVLHNGITDLAISVLPGDATGCSAPNGVLYVSVSGGSGNYKYTLNGASITVTNGEIHNLTPGVYVVNVIDLLDPYCEASSGEVRISSPAATLAVNITNIVDTECGSNTGAVTFTVTGSNSYTYQLDGQPEVHKTANTPIMLSGLHAGEHILRVWDDCKEIIETIIITNGENALAFTATTKNEILSCTGDLIEGSITLTITDGILSYSYRIDGGEWIDIDGEASTVTITGLHTGIYRVEVKDANDCTYEINNIKILREIYTPINIGTYFTALEPTCGQANGKIQVYATGGSGVYEYSVNGQPFTLYTDGLITNLAAGNYTITVRDANSPNCPAATVSNIVLHNNNTDLAITVTPENATSCTNEDGKLYISVNGGTGDYEFMLNGVVTQVTDGVIDGLKADVYVVTVTDRISHCTASSGEVRITSDLSTLAVNINNTVNTVCGSSTGSATFTVTGSTNYTYQLDGYPEVSGTSNAPILLTGLDAGVHILRVWDNCKEIEKEIIITNGTNTLAFTATTVDEIMSCDGELTEGSITLTVTNGSLNYQYRIDGGAWISFANGATTVTIPDLHSGVYRVEVQDANNCTYEINKITILRDTYVPINVGTYFVANEPTCGQSNGSIQVMATGGSGEYLYSVNGGAFTEYKDGLITGLAAGTYTIAVQDANYPTCTPATIQNIVLHNSNTDLVISVTANNASSCIAEDGVLNISVSGGTGSYIYYINGVIDVEVVNGMRYGLPVGKYVVTVEDQVTYCTASSEEVWITSDASTLAVSIDNTVNTVCGSSTGSITFTVTGSNSYTYQLDSYPEVVSTVNTPIMLSGLNAGVHTLRVWDDCKLIVEEIILTNGENTLAFTATTVNAVLSCHGTLAGGSITLTVTNGTPNFQYRIDGGVWENFDAGSYTVTIPGLNNGVYRVEVRDLTECTFEMNDITILRDNYKEINVGTVITEIEPTCGQSNGAIRVIATGGSGIYEYSVNNGPFYSYPGGLITGLKAGTYEITVRDAVLEDCPQATIHSIILYNIDTDLLISVTATQANSCTAKNGTLYLSVSGGSGEYDFLLNGESVIVYNNMIINQSAGVYVVTVIDAITGCVASSGEVRITSSASNLEFAINTIENTICGSSTGSATFTVTGANNNTFTYQLDGHPDVKITGSAPVTLTGLTAGEHTLRIWDECKEIVETFIITNGENALAFTATTYNEILSCDGELIGGSIVVTVTDGTPNFKYRVDSGEWKDFDGNSSTVTISGLFSGIYLVEVMDANKCVYEMNSVRIYREIYTPINVGTYFVAVEPTCGEANGEIQIIATGGSGVYEYSVNGEPFTTYPNGLIKNLAAGVYEIKVRDANSPLCHEVTISNIVLYNGDTDLMITVTAEDASTCTSPDGKLIITVTGGSGVYSYTVNGMPETITDGVLEGLKAGLYEVIVTDVIEKCAASSGEVRISSQESELMVTINSVANTVCGSSTGSINFMVTGSATFTYQLDGHPEVEGDASSPVIVLTGLGAGVHTLKVWNDCYEVVEEIVITNGAGGLAFTATATNEVLSCEGDLIEGSITLKVTNGTPDYKYRIDGGLWNDFDPGATTVTIPKLHSGVYFVEVQDKNECTYEVNNVTILRETSYGTLITPPVATTPQTFCASATVANLQATGTGIKWYLTPEGGVALASTTELVSETIYYAAQSIGTCESQVRTAVKVFIVDELVLDAPVLDTDQSFCVGAEPLTLADIATNGNTNIVWYDAAVNGELLPLTTPLADNTSYFAEYQVGNCQSTSRTEVHVTFTTESPNSVDITSPQQFCEGAMIANIAVPNNQIVWYASEQGGEELAQNHVLAHNVTYYAAQKAGYCQSEERTPVLILITQPEAPDAPEIQTICGKLTLADLTVTGSGIVWYDQEFGGTQLPLTTVIEVGKSYWAAQSSSNDCEGLRTEVKITDECYVVYGTMFPFVKTVDPAFDAQFPVTVKLHPVPALGSDPVTTVLTGTPIQTVLATYYDGTIYIPTTPKNPGIIGNTNNPGLPIDWASLGKTVDNVNNELVSGIGDVPTKPVGMFKFENIAPGDYILEVGRDGFLIRWGKVTINENGMSLGHRELIAGDLNKDLRIDLSDISNASSVEFEGIFDPRFDLDGNNVIDQREIQIIIDNINAFIGTYVETMQWVSGY
ncbi:MAG: hypothetical protein LBU83_07980 [Bacteroidales bacterium]|jgi:hypothetical protein|nr:hypothetical protein [Bacteroidales bacterium]